MQSKQLEPMFVMSHILIELITVMILCPRSWADPTEMKLKTLKVKQIDLLPHDGRFIRLKKEKIEEKYQQN